MAKARRGRFRGRASAQPDRRAAETIRLEQNYPNPFNPATDIRYRLSTAGFVTVRIYNLLGQAIRTLVEKQAWAGDHTVRWDGRDDMGREVPSGVYLLHLEVVPGDGGEPYRQVRKMTLLR